MSRFMGELSLTDELRGQLGLKENESARLLHGEGRTILLARVEEGQGLAVPWDRDLVMTASVQAFPLADILSMLHRACKSGFLLFGSSDHQKAIYLHRGEVVFAASNQEADRLGESLFRGGAITLEQLRDADASWSPHARLGKVLVERGVLSPRELWNGVKIQVEEIVRSLFVYTIGSVHFWEGEVQPDNVVRLSLPTRRLISEGLRRRDELLQFLAALEDPCVKLAVADRAGENLSGNTQMVFDALEVESHFSAVCRHAGLDPLSGARTIQLLRLAGVVKVTRDASTQAMPSAGEVYQGGQAALRSLVVGHVKLIAELVAPLVASDGVEAVGERVESFVLDATDRYPELLAGFHCGTGGVLDGEELTRRALRLAGDRERYVSTALSEIVSYLEFELRNHPHIEDADIYLDALEEQRSQLDL